MYRLMLVDDRPTVLAGLRQLGQWEELGVVLAGEALDGASALHLAEENPPDILLTDIRMPIMDGLELSRRVLERWPRTRIILLTGYDEFEYARTALRLGAVEYLTKPSTVAEIRSAVQRAVAQLDAEQAVDHELESLRSRLEESMPLLRQEYLTRLLQGHLAEADLPGILQFASIPLPAERLAVICFGLDLPGGDRDPGQAEIARLAFARLLETVCPPDSWTLARGRDGNPVLLGTYPKEEDPAQTRGRLEALAERCLATAAAHGIPASAGVSRQAPAIGDLPQAYQEAYTALQQRFFLGAGAVIHMEDLGPAGCGRVAYPAWAEEQIALALRAGAEEQVLAGLEAFFRQIAAGGDRQHVQMMCEELAVVMTRVLRELGVEGAPPDCRQLSSLAVCQEGLTNWLTSMARTIRSGQQSRQVNVITQLSDYIQSHLGGDCSLATLAEVVHLSPTYLAQLFKRQTGRTVLEYVTDAKMERAKLRLVTSEEKVTAICDELGYGDQRHFVDLFRRATGCTPTEYRAQFRSGGPRGI